MKTKPTKIISFRVPDEVFNQVNKQAKKEKKKRAELVETLFLPAFQQHVEARKTEKQGV